MIFSDLLWEVEGRVAEIDAAPTDDKAPTETQRVDLHKLLSAYEKIFQEPHGLPPPRTTDHSIPIVERVNLVSVRPYRYAHAQKDEIEKLVSEMLAAGVIRPSTSPYSSPVILVRKKDGSWCFCVDYRQLNKVTVPDKYPIPVICDMLDELQGAEYFSKLNLHAGYHQIRVRAADVLKTTF